MSKNVSKEVKNDSQVEKVSQEFNNRCYGIIIVKSQHSNFNADFSGFPRRLPDKNGTIYATDKALKYAIRRYWVDKGEKVFVWKEYKADGSPYELKDRIAHIANKDKSNSNSKDTNNIINVLLNCIDVRCFGITYAVEKNNYSICGPVQISYGVNRFNENVVYSNQILSPYKTEESAKQSTIGSETKAMESHYVFDFVINPNNLYDHYEELKNNENIPKLTNDDIDLLKEAMCKGVTNLNSCSKIGSENEFLLFITLNENSSLQLPTMKDLVSISKDEDKYKIDLSKIFTYLEKFLSKQNTNQSDKDNKDGIEQIELYYNQDFVIVEGIKLNNIKYFDLNLNSKDTSK